MSDENTQPLSEAELFEKITAWDAANKEADKAKLVIAKEQALRKELFALVFPSPKSGTNAQRVGFGMALVGKPKTSWSVDRPLLTTMMQSPNLRPLIEEVVDFAPKVRDGAFEKLSPEDKLQIAPALTAKPGSPELELRPEGKVRWK